MDGEFVAVAGRKPLSSASVGFILGLEAVVLVASFVVFGIDFLIPLQFCIVAAWLITQAGNVSAAMIVGNAALGLLFSHYLFGFVLWPTTILGFIATVSLALSATNLAGSKNANPTEAKSGDANPIAYIVAIVAGRAYLATAYTSVSDFDSFSANFLNWLGIFVFGIVPGWPVIANVISAVLLNGTLAVYLVLLLKRIANPVAN